MVIVRAELATKTRSVFVDVPMPSAAPHSFAQLMKDLRPGGDAMAELTYVDEDADEITVSSEPEWREALNFHEDGVLAVRVEVPELPVPASPPSSPEEAAVPAGGGGNVTRTPAHGDASSAQSCAAIPRRVSRATIMRRNTNYEFAGTPENMPPVIREKTPMTPKESGADDEWEEVAAAETEAPSMWEFVTGGGAEPPPAPIALEGAVSTM